MRIYLILSNILIFLIFFIIFNQIPNILLLQNQSNDLTSSQNFFKENSFSWFYKISNLKIKKKLKLILNNEYCFDIMFANFQNRKNFGNFNANFYLGDFKFSKNISAKDINIDNSYYSFCSIMHDKKLDNKDITFFGFEFSEINMLPGTNVTFYLTNKSINSKNLIDTDLRGISKENNNIIPYLPKAKISFSDHHTKYKIYLLINFILLFFLNYLIYNKN